MNFELTIKNGQKIFRSENYNYNFRLADGFFIRWGKHQEDDPAFSPFGPEIADVEITTGCNGYNNKTCLYCYKNNKPGHFEWMSFDTFKKVIAKINPNGQLTQVAFGLDAQAIGNPDIWEMCKFLRENNIIPNGTVANIDSATADKIAEYFGACAVSAHFSHLNRNYEGRYYDDGPIPYDVFANQIKMLTDRGMHQVNCHFMIAEETYNDALKLIDLVKEDERLAKLNAIVFLSLKKVGRATKGFTQLSQEKFASLIDYALKANIGFGFDSCSAPSFEKAINSMDLSEANKKRMIMMSEPCESSCFSIYVNVKGDVYPCSFNESNFTGYSLLNSKDFINDYWNNNDFRNKLLLNNRECPVYQIR